MLADRWRRVEEVFEKVADLAEAEQEAALTEECAGDRELLEQVRRLLLHDRSKGARIAEAIGGISQTIPQEEASYCGRKMGPYRIVREIGRGGMGVVYEAVRDDDEFRKRVALKVAARAAYSADFLARFRHERQILAQLEHPNIARLLDGGVTEDGTPFLAMQYVEGVGIHQYVEANDLALPARVRLFLQVCDAVEYAHQNLVIHRDLKPANILVSDGSVRLLDFGIAKLADSGDGSHTRTGLTPVTPDYCSPEQITGQPVTTRTDVYCLGLVLYELLTGERAQSADISSPVALSRSICETEVPAPSTRAKAAVARRLRGDLDTIVLKAAQKDPARRYSSAAALGDDLRLYLDGEPIRARQDSGWYRAGKFARRYALPLAAGLLLAMTLIGGIVATSYQAQRAERRFGQVRRIANALMVDVHKAIRDLPASTKAQEVVVRTAIDYLDGLAKEASGDKALQVEVAQGYMQVAILEYAYDRPSLNRPEEAKRNLAKAQVILDSLRKAHPDDAAIAAASTLFYVQKSGFLEETNHWNEGLETMQQAITIGDAGLQRHPNDFQLLDAMREALSMLLAGYETSLYAQKYVPRALEISERVFRMQPETANSLANLGNTYAQAGRMASADSEIDKAFGYFQRNAGLLERVVALEPESATARRNLMLGYSHIADLALGPLGTDSYTGSGGPAVPVAPEMRRRALEAMQKAIAQAEWLYQRDPRAPSVRFDYAICLGRSAPAYEAGDPAAILALEKSIGMLRRLEDEQSGPALRFMVE
ncbi:MAG: protein kinase, partial [Bryobacterales bacterium]|nr:protein kinase [Bryobacterales bacterium]